MNLRICTVSAIGAILALTLSASAQTTAVSSLGGRADRSASAPSNAVPAHVAYQLERSVAGSFQGQNAAQQMTLEFNREEARLNHSSVSTGLRLTGYGYGQKLRTPLDAQLTGSGNRLEYRRGELTEWYVNQSDGVEQGFTFSQRPGVARNGEPLVIALTVTGDLHPVLAADGGTVLLQGQGRDVFTYAGLRSWDAQGREVASRLEVRDQEIRLLVDDRDAEYPLVVDPVTALTATWATAPAPPPFLGDPVTITATATPNAAIVAFYDNSTVIGYAPVTAGSATFTTAILPSVTDCLGTPGKPCVHTLGARVVTDAALVTFNLTVNAKPSQTFAFQPDLLVGTNPEGIVIGDFNNDGFTDLATANLGGNISVILNNNGAPGTFFPPAQYAAGSGPRAIAAGDFNEDGCQDIVVVNFSTGATVLKNNKVGLNCTGTFPTRTTFPTNSFPEGVAVGDINGDGHADIFVVNNRSNDVTVLLGDGTGNFTQAANSPFVVGTGPSGIAVGDFTGDGVPELAIANSVGANITLLLALTTGGVWNGNFIPIPMAIDPNARSLNGGQNIAAADLDLDGKLDLVYANFLGASVLLGNGNGTFKAAVTYPADSSPAAVAVGDFDGDGFPDLAIANAYSNDISILIGNGDGTFQPPVNFPVGSLPFSLAVGDFNGDHHVSDLAVGNFGSNSVSLLEGAPLCITAATTSTPQATTVNKPFPNPLIATVTDCAVVPTAVPGVKVNFIAPTTGASATFSPSAQQTTDLNGQVQVTATANGTSGLYNVTAVAGFAAKATYVLTNLPGSNRITIVSGNPQSTMVNAPFFNQLVVRVTNSNNVPLQGVSVFFLAPDPAAGASITTGFPFPLNPVTDVNGLASVGVVANGTVGSYIIKVTAAGVPNQVTFSLTNTGPPTTLKAIAGTPQSSGVNNLFNAFIAKVTDSAGTGVAQVLVTFTVVPAGNGASGTFPGNVAQVTVPTGQDGTVIAPAFTANSIGGSYSVQASLPAFPGVSPVSFFVTNLGAIAPPPANITMVKGNLLQLSVNLPSAVAATTIITISSSDSSIVSVTPANVLVPAGTSTGRAKFTLTAVNVGTAVITECQSLNGIDCSATFGITPIVTTVNVVP